MFDPMQPGGLAEADAVARHGDGVVVTRLFGHESLETGMLEGLLSGAPGPEVVGLLTAIEAAPLTDREAITVAQAWERVGRWVAARQHRANLRVAGPAPRAPGHLSSSTSGPKTYASGSRCLRVRPTGASPSRAS